MSSKKHIIVYSHGFGVRKDDLGLLSDIAEAIPEVESVLFDYFDVNEDTGTLTTCTISEQVEKLKEIVSQVRSENPDAIIDLICHSQGTVVAALAQIEDIRKAILLAPVFDMGIERTLKRYENRAGAEINLEGMSILPALDGVTRYVPAAYWKERVTIMPIPEFNKLAEITDVTIVKANQDQILPDIDMGELSKDIYVMEIDGNHNFENEARKPLLGIMRDIVLGE